MGIRHERSGFRAYVRAGGRLRTKRFPAGTPRQVMEAWIAEQRTIAEEIVLQDVRTDFWRRYRPGWITGLQKTLHGWRLQISVNSRPVVRRFPLDTPLATMLEWRDEQEVKRRESDETLSATKGTRR